MQYHDAKEDIKSGDLLAFKGESWMSSIIRRFTKGSWTHVGIAWKYKSRLFILEARQYYGVSIRPVSDALPCGWISIPTTWNNDVEEFALERLGKTYSYQDAIKVGLGIDPIHDDRVCSLYAAAVLRKAGIPVNCINPHPDRLVQYLLQSEYPLVEIFE